MAENKTAPHFFATKEDFRKWFKKNHDKETELLVGFYKTGSGKRSITWPESVDEALCFGWIDAVRRSIDDISYSIRFTKRKPASIWSAINIAKVEHLIKQGLMQPEGLAAFEKRKEHSSKIYSYENKPVDLDKKYEQLFKANKTAWTFFNTQAPYYRKTVIYHIMSAKQEATRLKRLENLIQSCEDGKRIKEMSYGKHANK